MVALALFLASVLLILYHHVGYPVLLHALAEKRRHAQPPPATGPILTDLPRITVIVPAHNEAAVIAAKIVNLAALSYPHEKLSFLIALDGCTDQTRRLAESAIAQSSCPSCFQLLEYPRNIGKVAVLNDCIGQTTSDIVALSDASALVGQDALIRAASHFANPEVGVVCSTYDISQAGGEGERAYWNYQTRIKADEATLAAPMGAHGAFYLIRRSLWSPLAIDTINDDFVLPMTIVLHEYRVVYDRAIVAAEIEGSRPAQDFRRRVRIGAGNLQQVLRLAGLGDPRRGALAFLFWSGKGLRALLPFLLLAVFVSTVMLAMDGYRVFQFVLAGEVAVLALTAVASRGDYALPPKLGRVIYLVQGHVALSMGAILLLTGFKHLAWIVSMSGKSRVRTSDTRI
jgi:cellulose synthase/poly-beta-1,6-N-acetylglucosamine synthase-like glycosyltransferase